MTKTLVDSAKVSSKVKSSGGNYEIGSFQVGERIIAPGGHLGEVTSVHNKKITITWENGLSAEYTPKQMQAWNYKKLEHKETYSVGQRVKVAHHKEKYYSDWNWGIITNISSKKIDVKMGNKFIIAVDIADIQPDTEQFWRAASGLHPVPSSLGIDENDPCFIRCDILPIEEQIKLCQQRISRQQWRIDDLIANCKHKKERDTAIASSQSIIEEENLRIQVLQSHQLELQRTPQIQDVHCPSCESPLLKLEDGCGVCGWTPVNFLEESQPQPEAVQKSKGRQRKGCLYKYLENKKLKDGTIASYPRVIGNRKPDNPTHWRWGFNWEEKIDGEWKGRSIGSIPVGAIAIIQSMQKEGVPLEEIIGFIRRAKSKK
ncbi:hypothetical protein Nos7524_5647 (plasmid) [Nostoc sp. PCC 7524]|uniref:hypothetical protein n=1 Tax=Nostoc sp. (strain ATCC 29411 / PCC 7524) TaxID=28072 RepID=UPI00029EC69B|nr:hypothetical protein [Nostoc sp. PCC 7524]AFY51337.1 hypothetical protein Nos7524_5647 [Nostoc sp. PCC 7524]